MRNSLNLCAWHTLGCVGSLGNDFQMGRTQELSRLPWDAGVPHRAAGDTTGLALDLELLDPTRSFPATPGH